jgi:ABC-type lipoprotein export system ATPase subunit
MDNVSKTFNGIPVFQNVSFEAKSGEIIAIKGKSGVGKSTLLNIIAGLEPLSSGEYMLNDINMGNKTSNELAKIRGESIGYISQYSPMVSKLTAIENITIPFLFKKIDNKQYEERINSIYNLSDRFGIQHLLQKKINKLSGGEIQRVGIIRALINNPQVIVADEPTGSLDDETALTILGFLKEMRAEGLTIVLATHSNLIANECDKIYQLTEEGLHNNTFVSI